MLIVFKVIPKAKSELEHDEFLKSLQSHHSGEVSYSVRAYDDTGTNGDIFIEIADDCIVLGSYWDKYIAYAIENGLPQYGRGKGYVPNWDNYVQQKMALQSRRPPEGIFPELKVTLASQ